MFVGPPGKPLVPNPFNLVLESIETTEIARHSIVRVVPQKFGSKLLVLLYDSEVPIGAAPHRYSLQSPTVALAGGFAPYYQFPFPGFAPEMGESKKIKIAVRSLLQVIATPSLNPEIDQSGLVRV